MYGLLPPLLLALFGAWCGTFAWGPSWPASAAAALALLGSLLWIAPPWRDPLRLGATGRLLPWALWIAMAASGWASPVPRAGWVALILLPAFLVLPGVVERCWRLEEERRQGLRALALVVAGVALWSLIDWLALGSPRPAMPLGHHNLLAAWLVILLPLAVLPARELGPWRFAGLAAGGLAAAAILASRSLAGCAALAAAALLAFGARAGRSRRRWGWLALLAAALLVSFVQLPRVLRIASGADLSAQARGAYLAAGIEGFQTRPMLGWGPGSVPWTAAAFLEPVLRVNPWGESVGDLHSLPVQLAYELGITGLLLVAGLIVLFFVRRIAEREEGRDPALLLGGLLGLGSGAVASLGSGALAVTALPLAAAVAAGAALAGSGRGKARSSRLPVRIYALAALLALAPLEIARWHYDRARLAGAQPGEAEAELAAAMRLDPEFPLYPMRLALGTEERDRAAGLALRAAEKGGAIPSLWLVAGVLGRSAKAPWAGNALERACFLDPLDPFPSYYGMLANLADPDAPARGAQALLNEPRLAAAVFWERHPELLAQSLTLVRAWPGVDAGWKEALLAAVPPPGGRSGPIRKVELTIDTEQQETLSLTAFRRRPWPTPLGLVDVRQPVWEGFRVPPAAASKGTAPGFYRAAPCRRSLSGQRLLTP
ncbi:MAG TPA: O-antigen ligase family protein [Thermoanaerobaculia bacterium]|jgi:O-antigen ligase|nr:O-antigen ligase family protein [Thermoanaerobaculia bacterium]